MNELVLSKELDGLEKSKAAQIEAVFAPMVEMLKGFESAYEEVMGLEQSEEKSKQAKRLRLDIAKVRIDADKVRKEQKEEYLRAGNAIQGVYNVLKFAVADKEEKLKEVETFYERIEAERKSKVQAERELLLSRYEIDGSTMNLSEMDEAVFDNLLSGSKAKHDAIKEAEKKAEQDRIEAERKQNIFYDRKMNLSKYGMFFNVELLTIDTTEKEYSDMVGFAESAKIAHDEEQEKIRIENEKLKKEREEKEKAEAEEREKIEAERKAQEEALRKEREAREAIERKAEQEKAEAERKELERLEAEKEANKKAELAPDKEKLMKLAETLLSSKDGLKSEEAKKAVSSAISIITDSANRM